LKALHGIIHAMDGGRAYISGAVSYKCKILMTLTPVIQLCQPTRTGQSEPTYLFQVCRESNITLAPMAFAKNLLQL
jgi:hypothetical protein